MNKKHPNVTNLQEAEIRNETKGNRFGFRGKRLGLSSGGRSLGCTWFELDPGRTAFPYHFHCANEEAIYVLEGEGELRIGKEKVSLVGGDYVALPPGPDFAHALQNTGKAPLRYLCMSTLIPTEVVGYPDSKKIAARGSDDASKGILHSNFWIRQIIKEQPNVDYYDGEMTD